MAHESHNCLSQNLDPDPDTDYKICEFCLFNKKKKKKQMQTLSTF